jgi:hypothetical protein
MSRSDYIVIISFVIAAIINNIIIYKLIKNEIHDMIYVIVKIVAFIVCILLIACTNIDFRLCGLTYFGFLFTVPRFKKKNNTTGH